MYGLAYCKLDYEYMLDLDLDILSVMIKAEIDKETHLYDLEMMKTAWQTAYIMNSTGNYKRPVKPEKLYDTMYAQKKKPVKHDDVRAKRDDLLRTFGLKDKDKAGGGS
ncbi:hypothetical protein JCM17380_24880 [Desulfosporosinus burensis]